METSGVGRSSWLVAASFLVLVLVSCFMNTGVEGAPEILCLANEECGTGLRCLGGKCVGCGDGTPCPFGTYCSFGASDVLSSCLRSRGNGDSCSSYGQCISWYCEYSTRTCQGCRYNEECHTRICEAGFCNECIPGTSHGCVSNQFCTSGTGTPRCRTLLPLGSQCSENGECASTQCHIHLCGECTEDSHCEAFQFCNSRRASGSRCEAKKSNGVTCNGDNECRYGYCNGETCGDCALDSDCNSGFYCGYGDQFLPQIVHLCVATLSTNNGCSRNEMCQSAICTAGHCRECSGDDQCSSDQYCELKGVNTKNRCFAKKTLGSACGGDTQCISSHCSNRKCVQCLSDSECSTGQFCKLENSAADDYQLCASLPANGAECSVDGECASSHCVNNICGECAMDGQCVTDEFCNTERTSGARCSAKKAIGNTCNRNEKCESAICTRGYCSECTEDDQCSSDQYCELNGATENRCFAKKNIGTACDSDTECSSGHCSNRKCVQCASNSDCLPGQICIVTNLAGTDYQLCASPAANGVQCSVDRACASTHCINNICGECAMDSQCATGEFCNTERTSGARCEAKKTNGAICGRSNECENGHCSDKTCGDCSSDSGCNSGLYCGYGDPTFPQILLCVATLSIGNTCDRNEMCQSAICSGGYCGECTEDDQCSSDQYCELNGAKENRCSAKKIIGTACGGDTECTSSHCGSNRKCVQCVSDLECSTRQICKLANPAADDYQLCALPAANGAMCFDNNECSSNYCYNNLCGDCRKDRHCTSGQFCNFRTGHETSCDAVERDGAECYRGPMCENGHCTDARCSQCTVDADCPASKYCGVLSSFSECLVLKEAGEVCSKDNECRNATCNSERCGHCSEDSQCSSRQYCSYVAHNLDTGELGPTFGCMKPSSVLGNPCARNEECSSEHCHNGVCADCARDRHCRSTSYCDDTNVPAATCTPKSKFGKACSRNAQCSSGICSSSRCIDCTNDSDCPSSGLYCNAVSMCVWRKCSGLCTDNRQCKNLKCQGSRCFC